MERLIAATDFPLVETTVDPATQIELLVPQFSSAEAEVARAAKERACELRVVRFFPDHGHPWPLWDSSVGYTASPRDLGLSADLTQSLRVWYDEWESAVGPGDPWKDSEAESAWLERGDELVLWLAREVWMVAVVYAAHRYG
jgi:hypothetical protein